MENMKVNTEMKYAGFWVRVFAATIDTLLFVTGSILVWTIPFYLFMNGMDFSMEAFNVHAQENALLINITNWIPVFIIAFIRAKFLLSNWQATPGKKLLGLKVVKPSGQKMTSLEMAFFRDSTFSFFILFFSTLCMILTEGRLYNVSEEHVDASHLGLLLLLNFINLITILVWFLPVAFTKEKKALHDMIFKTRVIYSKK